MLSDSLVIELHRDFIDLEMGEVTEAGFSQMYSEFVR